MTRHLRLLPWFADDPAQTTPRSRPSWWRETRAAAAIAGGSSGLAETGRSQAPTIPAASPPPGAVTRSCSSGGLRRGSRPAPLTWRSEMKRLNRAASETPGSLLTRGYWGRGIGEFQNGPPETDSRQRCVLPIQAEVVGGGRSDPDITHIL